MAGRKASALADMPGWAVERGSFSRIEDRVGQPGPRTVVAGAEAMKGRAGLGSLVGLDRYTAASGEVRLLSVRRVVDSMDCT